MLDSLFLFYIGFFTLLPAIFFFALFLMLLFSGLYFGLSQIVTYRQVAIALANVETAIKKHVSNFHFPDSWHLPH